MFVCSRMCAGDGGGALEEVPARCWGSNRWETGIWTAGIHCLSQTLYTNHLSTISPFCHSRLCTVSFLSFFFKAVKPGWEIKSNKSNYETTCFVNRSKGRSRGTRQLGTFRGFNSSRGGGSKFSIHLCEHPRIAPMCVCSCACDAKH